MAALELVVDTNVLLSGLRSSQGASHKFLRELGQNSRLQIHLSVPLVLEYEEVMKREARLLGLTYQDIDEILDYLCSIGTHHQIFYLWRPFLRDVKDDMLLELAVEAQCHYVVTFNRKDFDGINRFGVKVATPQALLNEIGAVL